MDFLNTLFDQLQPVILEAVSVIVGAAILWVANLFRLKTGLEIEARHRAALHSAIMSGVRAAMKDGVPAGRDALIDSAVAYVRESVPDAMRRLGPKESVLRQLAEGYVSEALDKLRGRGA